MNTISILGRLTKDAEVRRTQKGTAVAGFTIASDVGFGDYKKTLFLDCSLWGKRAESKLVDYLNKGTQVFVSGNLEPDDWTDRDGNTRKGFKINVAEISLAGGRSESQEKAAVQPSAAPIDPFANAPDPREVPVDDLPF